MTVKIEQKTQDLGGPYDIYELYLHLREKRETEYSFFFESVKEETKEPLYSYICLDPDLFIQIDNEKLSFPKILTARGEKFLEKMNQLDYQEIQNEKNLDDRVDYDVKSLDMLSNVFSDLKSKLPSNFSRQVFYGGLLGYIGWDVLSTWVGFDKKSRIPDILLGLHTRVLIYDHKQTKLYMVDNVPDKINFPENLPSKSAFSPCNVPLIKPDLPITTLPEVFTLPSTVPSILNGPSLAMSPTILVPCAIMFCCVLVSIIDSLFCVIYEKFFYFIFVRKMNFF